MMTVGLPSAGHDAGDDCAMRASDALTAIRRASRAGRSAGPRTPELAEQRGRP